MKKVKVRMPSDQNEVLVTILSGNDGTGKYKFRVRWFARKGRAKVQVFRGMLAAYVAGWKKA